MWTVSPLTKKQKVQYHYGLGYYITAIHRSFNFRIFSDDLLKVFVSGSCPYCSVKDGKFLCEFLNRITSMFFSFYFLPPSLIQYLD